MNLSSWWLATFGHPPSVDNCVLIIFLKKTMTTMTVDWMYLERTPYAMHKDTLGTLQRCISKSVIIGFEEREHICAWTRWQVLVPAMTANRWPPSSREGTTSESFPFSSYLAATLPSHPAYLLKILWIINLFDTPRRRKKTRTHRW